MSTAAVFAATCAWAPAASATLQNATAIDAFTLGEYWESQLHSYGTAVTWSVSNNASYANLESVVVGLSGTAAQTGDSIERDLTGSNWPVPFDPPLITDNYIPFLGTNAKILAGTNTSGASTTVSMAWRNRTDIEVDNRGYPGIFFQRPPLAYDSYNMISDIVDLTGTPGTYVLEFEYDQSQFVFDKPTNTEAIFAQGGFIYLGWFEDEAGAGGGNVATREWVNAIDGNTATGASAVTNYQGSYADFLADAGQPDAGNLALTLGSWGVDTADDTVWAIIDHNSEFAVVPEPATLPILALGAFMVMRRRR